MLEDPAVRIPLARDRGVAAGLPVEAADRAVMQALALSLHLGDTRRFTDHAGFRGLCGDLSSGPGGGDRSLFHGAIAGHPGLSAAWPEIVGLLTPVIPLDADDLGAAREALLGGARKTSGSFYTRAPLARALARRTLAGWLASDPITAPTVCDPAMGCGSLLLAALALLGPRVGVGPALAGLHGVDADPLAVDLARFNVWRAAGSPAEDLGLAARLVCGDSLVGAWIAGLDEDVPEDRLKAALDRRVAGLTDRPLHWELAFPAVMRGPAAGFAVVLANPPWDAIKPNAREFMAMHGRAGDPAEDATLAPLWAAHLRRHAALSRWFGPGGPYRHQGRADHNAYKLFVERCLRLLAPDGALGLLVPAGIYSDHATAGLRRLLLTTCRWTHLYAFQNERFVFPGVDHRMKVAFVGATRGGATEVLRTRFRVGPGEAPSCATIEADMLDEAGYLARTAAALRAASPTALAIAELRDAGGEAVFAAVHARTAPLLARPGWGARYAREFDMARDAALFPAVAWWEARGHRADEYGHWLAGAWRAWTGDESLVRSRDGAWGIAAEDVHAIAVPLLQGAQIHQHTSAARAWRCGTGLRATWDPVDPAAMRWAPQYLIDHAHARRSLAGTHVRVGYREVARSTDTRTLIAAVLPPFPAGHKVPNLLPGDGSVVQALALCAELNSLCADFAARARLGASSLTAAFLADTPLGDPGRAEALAPWAARLGLTHPRFAPLWQDPRLRALLPDLPWRDLWAVTPHARLRLRCILDALVAHHRGLAWADMAALVAGCDHPAAALRRAAFARTLDPKGFWRVDRDRDPELRLPVLALVAYHDLCAGGAAAFVAGDGWQLPATLRLRDFGLGHDDRAGEAVPVAARLGPACPEVQVGERGWDACDRHARRITRLTGGR